MKTARSASDLDLMVTRIPYAVYLGLRVDLDEEGVLARLPFRNDLVGNAGLPALHGGVVGAFLELTALFQLLASVRDARIPKPINFNVNFLRSAGPLECLARARVVKHGKRIANVEVVAWQGDRAKPVASGFGNFLL
ncbi:MAG: PaaI family thioesterase [Deltaproteobacteria bacterium]|nr:PaaI family thioesterase [Deltaproteobacteria bacterium]